MGKRGRPKKTDETKEMEAEKVASPIEVVSAKGIETLGNQSVEKGKDGRGSASAPDLTPPAGGSGGSKAKTSWSEEVERENQVNPNLSTENRPRKWVDVITGNRDTANGWTLEYSPPLVNTHGATITKEESTEACATWENLLVRFVLGAKPRFWEMASYANGRWRSFDPPKVHLLQEGVFLFDFNCAEAKERVMEQNWVFKGQPLILRPWSANLDLQNLDVEKVPVWVKFPQLPLSCWTPRILSKIASCLGVPIATDQFTARKERLSYARVLVEMKISTGLVFQVPVHDHGRDFMQDVVYEWRPLRCGRCKKMGHGNVECHLPPQQIWAPRLVEEEKGEEKGEEMEEGEKEPEEGEVVEAEGEVQEPAVPMVVTNLKPLPEPTKKGGIPPKKNQKINQLPPQKQKGGGQVKNQKGGSSGQTSTPTSIPRKMPNVRVEDNQVTVFLPPNG